MLMPEESFADFGHDHSDENVNSPPSGLMAKMLGGLGRVTYSGAKLIILGVFVLAGIAWVGIGKIVINDNPVKWFSPSHEIRVADRALNARFAGNVYGLSGSGRGRGRASFPVLRRPDHWHGLCWPCFP